MAAVVKNNSSSADSGSTNSSSTISCSTISCSTLEQFKALKDAYEADGRQALGVHLPASDAKELRRELTSYYAQDPGEWLTTIYGVQVLSIDADEFSFEE